MYKVMLVDDDYPVLELLSDALEWEKLGMSLQGAYENGAVALEAARSELPDIVITDIGMPRIDGLELIRHLKELKPNVRVAILSCHSEFHFAQQAMKLNVQDYILKDTLDPDDLGKLLRQFKQSLDQERQVDLEQYHLRNMLDRNKAALKESFINGTINQPMLDSRAWLTEAESLGLSLAGKSCLPVMGFMDEHRLAKLRFISDDVLNFALNNVIEEVLHVEQSAAVYFPYDSRTSALLFPFQPGLHHNPYDEAAGLLQRMQSALRKSLKITVSFVIGTVCEGPEELKLALGGLVAGRGQRFYMKENTVVHYKPLVYDQADLFSWYDEALSEFREMLIQEGKDAIVPTVNRWTDFLGERRFPPHIVKDWVLKLMLDLKLKLQSMQFFRNAYTVDILHNDILDIDSLSELRSWLIAFFQSALSVAVEAKERTKRTEVLDACQYVSLHLNRRISLEEVADHLFLNPSYFSRLFKKETGETFIEYVTRMKLDRAKELLDQTSHSVGKISEMLGYDNQSYFIKLFKSVVGVTPLEYRGVAPSGKS